MEKTECAFRISGSKCSILSRKICGRCAFRLTKEELKEKQRRSEERLKKRFSLEEMAKLREKYGQTSVCKQEATRTESEHTERRVAPAGKQ